MDVSEQRTGIASLHFAGRCKPFPGSCGKNVLFFTPVKTQAEQSPVPLSRTLPLGGSLATLVVTRRAPKAGSRDGVDQDDDDASEPGRDPYYHFTVDYGYIQPTSLRQGRVHTGISERTKQEVLSADPMDGFTAVRNARVDPAHSIGKSLYVLYG
jgi:hypothetical protein